MRQRACVVWTKRNTLQDSQNDSNNTDLTWVVERDAKQTKGCRELVLCRCRTPYPEHAASNATQTSVTARHTHLLMPTTPSSKPRPLLTTWPTNLPSVHTFLTNYTGSSRAQWAHPEWYLLRCFPRLTNLPHCELHLSIYARLHARNDTHLSSTILYYIISNRCHLWFWMIYYFVCYFHILYIFIVILFYFFLLKSSGFHNLLLKQ